MVQEETIRVRYIGPKPTWQDKPSLYGSGLDFTKGQVREVPAALGKSFLRHRDLFERASEVTQSSKTAAPKDDTAAKLAQAKKVREEKDEATHQRLDVLARIDQMDRRGLMAYARDNYRQSLSPKASTETMREQVRGLIEQFGIVGGVG